MSVWHIIERLRSNAGVTHITNELSSIVSLNRATDEIGTRWKINDGSLRGTAIAARSTSLTISDSSSDGFGIVLQNSVY